MYPKIKFKDFVTYFLDMGYAVLHLKTITISATEFTIVSYDICHLPGSSSIKTIYIIVPYYAFFRLADTIKIDIRSIYMFYYPFRRVMTIIQSSKRIRRATARHLDGLQMGYRDYCNAVSTSTEFFLATDLYLQHEDTLVLNNQRMSKYLN